MRVLVLGAGQDVGRSCVVVRLGGKTLMFDCGMHLGYNDARRFPDFSLLSPTHDYTAVIDALFISHFHLDHVGALPYFTEVCGYQGPVFMTHPTRAITPLMLQDYYKVLLARPGSGPLFALHHIDAAMAKVQLMDLQETVQVCEGVEATAYYAGHVLGAAMIHVRVGCESLVYTGDFNTVPERHLAGACIERLAPDLLISEATYAAIIRDDRRAREHTLLDMVHATVTSGGKVLVPVSAVGRAQELLMLLHEHWQRTGLHVPIYMSSIMAGRANAFFKLLQNWASGRVKQAAPGARSSAFDYAFVRDWQPELINSQATCVLFATPGMLQGGVSLEVFKAWAPDPRNLVLLPSYQVAGTVGRKLMLGVRKGLQIDARTTIDVNCKTEYASLSAHSDAKGVLQLVQQVAPRAVMFVHGELDKMAFMADKLQRDLGLPCFMPGNGEEVCVQGGRAHAVPVSAQLLRRLPARVEQLAAQRCAAVLGAAAAQQQQQQQQQQQSGALQLQSEEPAAAAAPQAGGAGGGVSVAEAAAGWMQQGDVGRLAAAAMQLAGLGPHHQQQQLQQQQLLHGTPAAGRAAQIAPWLELLGAAAQQAWGQQAKGRQSPPLPASSQGTQEGTATQAEGAAEQQQEARGVQGPCDAHIQAAVSCVTLSHQLQQQLDLQQQAVVVDGVLLLHHAAHHRDGPQQQEQQQEQQEHGRQPQMQLLPAEAAAAALQMQQHRLRLTCRLQLPPECWATHQEQQQQQLAAAAAFVADVLRAGLPAPAAQLVGLDAAACAVALGTITFRQAVGDGARCALTCSWLLPDDALAQHCVSLLRAAAATATATA